MVRVVGQGVQAAEVQVARHRTIQVVVRLVAVEEPDVPVAVQLMTEVKVVIQRARRVVVVEYTVSSEIHNHQVVRVVMHPRHPVVAVVAVLQAQVVTPDLLVGMAVHTVLVVAVVVVVMAVGRSLVVMGDRAIRALNGLDKQYHQQNLVTPVLPA